MKERKAFNFAEFKVDAGSGEFSGYGSIFGNLDAGGDVVVPGAFAKAIPDFLRDGFISWSHDWAMPVAMPKGAHEDQRGLFLAGKFHSTPDGQQARTIAAERAAEGLTMGLSIGYGVEEEEWGPKGRLLKVINPLYEVGLVMVPMNREAGVVAVKGAKAAVPSHSTATTDEPWDGGMMDANCPAERAPLRASHAWVDAAGDPDAKGSYKFIHHFVADDGTVGAASIIASSTGIGYLNRAPGATGRPDIPEADREGVWAHLARHLRDADREPPELRGLLLAGLPYADHIDRVLAEVVELRERGTDVAGLRAKEGRTLSAASRQRLMDLASAWRSALDELESFIGETEPAKSRLAREAAALAEWARFVGVPIE